MKETTALMPLMELRNQWVDAFGNDLISLAAFGDILQVENFSPHHDSIGLLLVLKQVTPQLLAIAAPPLAAARKKLQTHVLTLTVEELERSCDVFPIKFRAMQQHHELLAGIDVLSSLNIATDHLRLRCEQELKNLMIRLRSQFLALRIASGKSSREFAAVMRSTRTPFLTALATAVELKSGDYPSLSQLPAKAAEWLGVDDGAVRGLLQLPASATFEQANEYLGIVEEAAHVVDTLHH